MTPTNSQEVTRLLERLNEGNEQAAADLISLVYRELRAVAGKCMQSERRDHTLQPTALVHEAYFRLVGQRRVKWQNRAHFFSIAARLMRRIVLDYSRRNHAAKRSGGAGKLLLRDPAGSSRESVVDILALDEALRRLEALDAQQARIVELRFFGDLTVEETASVLGISTPTVKREWHSARAWLFRELFEGKSDDC